MLSQMWRARASPFQSRTASRILDAYENMAEARKTDVGLRDIMIMCTADTE